MYNVNAISAFFFYLNNVDDPNIELSKAEEQALRDDAQKFLDASAELLARMETEEYANEVEAQLPFYDIGKKYYGEEKKKLLSFFSQIYMLLFETKYGPRLGAFTYLLGREAFIARYRERLANPLSFPIF